MTRQITPGSVDQSLVFWAYDTDGDGVALTPASDGIAVSVRVDADGREGTPVALTLTTRDVVGTHKDSAITHVGGGKHEVDLADSYFAAANTGKMVTLELAADDAASLTAEKVTLLNVPTATQIREEMDNNSTQLAVAAAGAVGSVEIEEDGDDLTLSFKGADGTTEVANVTYTPATGARTRNS